MNTRLLGTLCMIGSAIWMLDGVRMAAFGLSKIDQISSAAFLVLGICGLCGILALVALRVTGSNPIFRVLSYLPAIGFLIRALASLLGLANPMDTNNMLNGIGFMLVMAGMIIVGILTLASNTWTGWRKIAPLLPVLLVPVAAAVGSVTGWIGMDKVVIGAGFALMGYAIATSQPVPLVRQATA